MQRKLVLGSTLAALILALVAAALFFWNPPGVEMEIGERSPSVPESDGAPLDRESLARAVEESPSSSPDPENAAEETVEDEGPVLLRGRVVGEGEGIEGAVVRFYPVSSIEKLLLRVEGLIPQGGDLPEIPVLVDALRKELVRFRDVGLPFTSGADGYFELRGVESGGYIALTLADGWLFQYGDVVSLFPERTEEITIELDRGAVIAGRVVSSAGAPIAGATVVAEYRPPGVPGVGKMVRRLLRMVNGEFLKGPFEAKTEVDGRFMLDSLPAGFYDLAAEDLSGVETRLELVETGTVSAVVVLGDPASIEGYFVDEQGLPATGVRVKLERLDDRIELPAIAAGFNDLANTIYNYLGEPPRHVDSGPSGGFRFAPIGAGKYRLSVEQPGILKLTREIELAWGERKQLEPIAVDRGRVIEGTVLSREGSVVPGASIVAFLAKPNLLTMGIFADDLATGRLQTFADQDGRFVLGGLRRTDYRILVTARGFAPAMEKVEKERTEPVLVEIEPGVRVVGRVLAAADETPLAGVRVRCEGLRVTSDENGEFVLDGVAPREGSGMNPFEGMGGPGGRRPSPPAGDGETDDSLAARRPTVTINAEMKGYIGARERYPFDELPREVELRLDRAPAIQGIVLDPDGEPAAGALVRLTPAFPDELDQLGFFDTSLIFLAVTVTGLDGKFRMEQFPIGRGGRLRVIADHVLYARGKSSSFEVGGGVEAMEPVEVTLVKGASIRGTITDGSRPVPGATIRLSRASGRERSSQEMMFFNMLGLPPGGTETHSNSEGEFLYRNILPGDYTLTAEVSGYTEPEPISTSAAEGEEAEVLFKLDPGGSIFGTVEDIDGAAIAEASVRLLREDGDERSREAARFLGGAFKRARSEPDGTWSIDSLPEGGYTVFVSKPGYLTVELRGVTPGKALERLVLERSSMLRGQVVDVATGLPITSFRVAVRDVREEGTPTSDPMAWRAWREHNDPRGEFQRDEIEPGERELEVRAAGYVPLIERFTIGSGETLELSFALARAGRIEGRVVDKLTGRPIEGASLEFRAFSPPLATTEKDRPERNGVPRVGEKATTASESDPKDEDTRALREHFSGRGFGDRVQSDSLGAFELEGIPDTPQTIVVRHPGYRTLRSEDVRVGLGEAIALDFPLERGLSISGLVLDATGAPAPGIVVFARGAGVDNRDSRQSATSDDAGRFVVEGLAPGAVRVLTVSTRGGRRGEPVALELNESASDLELRLSEPAGR